MDGIRLRPIGRICALAVLFFGVAARLPAQDYSEGGQATPEVVTNPCRPFGVGAPFRDGPYGAHTHCGMPDAPSVGYEHYDLETERYDHWYLPNLFGWKKPVRCSPRLFRPRGFGNLSNPPATCHRMDYHPFVLTDAYTRFGPSYYTRLPDQRCDCDCEHCCEKSEFRCRNERACLNMMATHADE